MASKFRKIIRREHILIFLLIIAAFLGLLDVPQRIGVETDQILLALVGLLALDSLLERLGYLDRIEERLKQLAKNIQPDISIDEMIHKRNEETSILSIVDRGTEIWVMGKSLRELTSIYGSQFQQALIRGKQFRILIVDPDESSAIRSIANNTFTALSDDEVKHISQESISAIKRIVARVPKSIIELKLTNVIPPGLCVIADGKHPNGIMIVQMYGYKISQGDRINMVLYSQRDRQIFTYYLDQFEDMWNNAKQII